ncbi:RNA binding motif protein 39b [Fimicolochytrium jonesii]|uniref:RNA binding motif protein 39b n=1 Tax=Fimicolochytrium jonesii TaxID=1396493 RepID=UPI0022FE3D60|nr:RNA binding motif protein 39b [Fimicolochytrium jonesii]KAI8818017.1 RNA binding motif protein 39b [Fimicolochytrium jonesii]
MVMELDVEQLLEAPFRKAGPPVSPEPTPSENRYDDSSEVRSKTDEKGVEKERRHRDRSRDRSDRDRRRSRSPSDRSRRRSSRKERSRSGSPRRRDDRDRDRERRRRSSRSRSPSRRHSRGDRRDSRDSRDHHRRRSSVERSSRRPPRDDRPRSPELDEYERDKRTVFVMQLAARLKQEELYDFFLPAGKVRDARIISDRNSRKSKGVGYVEFYDVESVPKAIAMSEQKLLGIPIIVQHTESEKNRIAAEAEAAARAEAPITRLYVGSLHFNLTESDLKDVFEPFGPIDRVDVAKDADTGRSRGFAFIHYRNPADAKQAMEKMNGFELMGRAIRVGHTEKVTSTTTASYSLDDAENGGMSLNNVSRMDLMAKLARDEKLVGANLPAKPVILPTRNVLLKNMFNLQEVQGDPGWAQDLKDDVGVECGKYGTLRHVGVDSESPDGRIYMKYNSIPEAEAAVNALNGRFFAGSRIEAAFVPDITYNGRFPEAAFE